MYIDTHSHIYEEEFREDRKEVITRAQDAGIGHIILPDIDSESRGRMLILAEQYPRIMHPLCGLHPTSVNENYKEELAKVEKEIGIRKYYGIGECGIDLYWDKTFYHEQIKAFEHQLGIARDMNLPIIIHSRDSLKVIFEVLKKHPYSFGILHCFPGTSLEANNQSIWVLIGNRGCDHLQKKPDGRYNKRNRYPKHRPRNRCPLSYPCPSPWQTQ